MAERLFMKKRQRSRGNGFLTNKVIVRLIVLSALMLGGFLYFIGDPTTPLCEGGCEGPHSLMAWILGFFMIFAAIIALAGVTGALFAAFRWARRDSGGSLSELMQQDQQEDDARTDR